MKLKTFLLTGLAAIASITIMGAAIGFTTGSSTSSAYTFGTTNFVAVDPNGIGNSATGIGDTPVATYVNATSDLNGSKFSIWYAVSSGQTCISNNSTTSIFTLTTNGLTAGLPCVINHALSGICEPRIVTSITATSSNVITLPTGVFQTNYWWTVVVNAAPTYNATNGDSIFGYALQGQISLQTNAAPVGGFSLTLGPAGGGVVYGQYGIPSLYGVNFTSAGAVNVVSGLFQ